MALRTASSTTFYQNMFIFAWLKTILCMKQTLQNLLAEGKTKHVIAELMQLHTGDTDLKAEIGQLAARYAE